MKRQRGRSRRSSGGQNHNINRHFESNGPDVKIRGSAQQVLEKYLQYAREAQTNGDRVKSEAYFQHAEHYQRTLAIMQANQKPKQRDRDDNRNRDQESDAGEEAEVETTATNTEPSEGASKDDPLRVIGDDGAEADAASKGDDAGNDTSADDEPKPKRSRRRTYKKRGDDEAAQADGETDAEADGVMKTLSRGRKPAKAKDEGAPDEGAETAEQAAAE